MFIKALVVDFSHIDINTSSSTSSPIFASLDDIFIILEEKIVEYFPHLEYDLTHNTLIIQNNNFIANDTISFADYIEEGKFLKAFLLEHHLANENNYKTFFSLQKRELDVCNSEMEQANEQE